MHPERRRPRRIPIGPLHLELTRRRIGDPAPGLCGNPVAKLLGHLGAIREDGQSAEAVVADQPGGSLLG